MNDAAEKSGLQPAEARLRLAFGDRELLAECEVHTHRTGGPGGQHRNKTETAVRLVHKRMDIAVTAGETRSQHENRARALGRLREAIAIKFRIQPVLPVAWPENVSVVAGRLRVADSNPALPFVLAIVLDHFSHAGGEIGRAADGLNITRSSLTKFLAAHPSAWVEANRLRATAGLHPLPLP